uniref:Uncharacterized protein n=1 Tax=Arundo donax TaxID=35708 RepID=A0A0A9EUC9_ARUDO
MTRDSCRRKRLRARDPFGEPYGLGAPPLLLLLLSAAAAAVAPVMLGWTELWTRLLLQKPKTRQ